MRRSLDISTKPVSIIFTGAYTDTLVKTREGWRLTKRVTTADAPSS